MQEVPADSGNFLWYMTDSIAVLEDSYSEVVVNVTDLSRLIWTPLKLVPPGTNFFEIFGPPPKNLFHHKGQRHEGKSVHASGPEGAKENQHVRVRCWSVLLATGSLKW